MKSIEMTDLDGDALTLTVRESSTWITCTSGAEEVTVGPLPTHLVHQLLGADAPGTDALADQLLTLSHSRD